MAEAGISDYFYGDEAEQFIYFRIPRQLITDPRFKHLSTDAKLLYTYQYFVNLYHVQQYQKNLCGASYHQAYLDFVCVDAMGNLLQPDFVSQKFQQLLRQHGLRPIRFHDLRHSCATIMLYLGYSLKDIQTWLGHSNYNFTADTYLHTAPTAHLQMANTYSEKLEELMPLPSNGLCAD